MSTTLIDVAYIAKLANISLTPEETETFSADLNKVLNHMSQLQAFDVTGIEPMYHPLPDFDVMRDDVALPGLTHEEALSNAPEQSQDQIRVPKVVESA